MLPTIPAIPVIGGLPRAPKVPLALRSSSTAGTLTSSLALPVPAGTVDGDVLIAVTAHRTNGVFATPAGWTLLGTQARGTAGNLQAFLRVASAEPANYTLTAGGSSTHVGVMLAIAGARTASPIDVAFTSAQDAGPVTSHVAPGLTPVTAGDLLVHAVSTAVATDVSGDLYTWATVTEAAEMSRNSGVGTGTGILSVATQMRSDTSAVAAQTATGPSSSYASFSLAVAPA